jgi:hypothetical protein
VNYSNKGEFLFVKYQRTKKESQRATTIVMMRSNDGTEEYIVTDVNNQAKESYYMVACVQCRGKHRKCDRRLPCCSHCSERNITCQYVPPKPRNHKRKRKDGDEQTQNPKKKSTTSSTTNNNDVTTTTAITTPSIANPSHLSGTQLLFALLSRRVPIQISTPRIEDITMKIQQALICSSYALVFQRAPCTDSMNASYIPEYYKSTVPAAGIYLHEEICEVGKKLNRSQLRNTADQLFQVAKETLLHPDVYPHLATDPRLTCSAMKLVSFILGHGKHERLMEAKMFLTAGDLFVQNNRNIFKEDGVVCGTPILEAELRGHFIISQLALLVFEIGRGIDSMSTVENILNSAIRFFDYQQGNPLAAVCKDIKQILSKPKDSLSKLYEYLQYSGRIMNSKPSDDNTKDFAVWKMNVLGFEFIIVNLELRQQHDPQVVTILHGLKADIVSKITNFCMQFRGLLLTRGAWSAFPYLNVCPEINAYASRLLASKSDSKLQEWLPILQSNVEFLESLYIQYELQQCQTIAKEMRSKIAEINTYLQQQQQQPQQPQQQLQIPAYQPPHYLDFQVSLNAHEQLQPSTSDILMYLSDLQGDELGSFQLDDLDSDFLL